MVLSPGSEERRHRVIAPLWVGLGSALGGMARYAFSGFVARRIGEIFPWGTLLVNISGGFVIGIAAAAIAPGGPLPGDLTVRQLVMIGLCGGYTTFSSFSLQTLSLARGGDWPRALGNIVASVALCLIAAWAGFALGALIPGG
jgi:fluoride exporter